MDLQIRLSSTQDYDEVFSLLSQLWPDFSLDKPTLETVYRRLISGGEYCSLCAVLRGRVIGFCSGYTTENLWYCGSLFYISALVVDSACREKHVGASLIDAVKEYAATQGCKAIELDSSFHRTGAHLFYEKVGFQKRAYAFSLLL